MREYEFTSCAAPQIASFVRSRTAAGKLGDSYALYLHLFDGWCAGRWPDAACLTQEMVDSWCEPRPTESPNSCRSRCYAVVSLVAFLRSRGETGLTVPELPRRQRSSYVPRPFSDTELEAFFGLCDSWVPECNMPRERALRTKWTLPVLFRLLWSSGIRTTEARLLRRGNVDLGDGVLRVVDGKGRNERLVALHPRMSELMREYDARMEGIMPGREYFFPNGPDTHLASDWVSKYFRKMWSRVSDDRATPYMLRHCYCTTAINGLVGRGVDGLSDLEWVSKAMGHVSVDETVRSYYHIVPGLAELLQQRSDDGFDDLVPGVDCHGPADR